jgi:hypothetical protein
MLVNSNISKPTLATRLARDRMTLLFPVNYWEPEAHRLYKPYVDLFII